MLVRFVPIFVPPAISIFTDKDTEETYANLGLIFPKPITLSSLLIEENFLETNRLKRVID